MQKKKLSSRAVYKSSKEKKNKVCKKLCHVLVKWMPMKYAGVEEVNGNTYSVTTNNCNVQFVYRHHTHTSTCTDTYKSHTLCYLSSTWDLVK